MWDWRIFATRQVIGAVVAVASVFVGDLIRPGLAQELRPHVVELLVALAAAAAAVDADAYRRSREDQK